MDTFSLVIYPAKILKKKAAKIKHIPSDIQELLRKMTATMCAADGIGLAAPQIGISKQIIIVEASHSPREHKNKPLAFINPVIEKKSRRGQTEEEGCLSLPGVFLPVKRLEYVDIVAQTPEGKEVRVRAQGLTARIFQHEIDHLQGKLIIDRIPLWKRFSIKRSLTSKGKTLFQANSNSLQA